jgi:hypothetical protein
MMTSNRLNSFLAGVNEFLAELEEMKTIKESEAAKVIDQLIKLVLRDLT